MVVPVPSLFSREGQQWLNHAHPPSRLVPSLGTVCEQEGLPPAHGFEQLPVGEQRVLQSLGVIDYVTQIHADRRTAHGRKLLTMPVKKAKESENMGS